MKVWRGGKREQIAVTIEALPSAPAEQAASDAAQAESAPRLNISVADLSAEERRAIGLADRGVLVQRVGPAANAGLRAGDVILRIAEKDVHSVSQLAATPMLVFD